MTAPAKPVGRPPERIKVVLRRGGDVEELLWPKTWPLPRMGETVIGTRLGGWVERVEFDVHGGAVHLVLPE